MDDEDLTQAGVAERLGVTQGAVSQLLKGQTKAPSLEFAVALERETSKWKRGAIRPAEWTEAA